MKTSPVGHRFLISGVAVMIFLASEVTWILYLIEWDIDAFPGRVEQCCFISSGVTLMLYVIVCDISSTGTLLLILSVVTVFISLGVALMLIL